MHHLLVVDDQYTVLHSFARSLCTPDLEVSVCRTTDDAKHIVETRKPDVVILDLCLPDASGLEVYDCIRQAMPNLPVIVITGSMKTDTAIEAMKRGAFDCLVTPIDVDRLRGVVTQAIEVAHVSRSTASNVSQQNGEHEEPTSSMVGQSIAMQEVYKAIGRVASQDVAVLILGESGTGKELVAQAVHRYSRRSQRPFVAINCAAIPESLLESELFGHEKGAFTGAEQRHLGKFEYAHGGTVFLDEIADMSSATQAKILRLIQEQQFERIGGTQTLKTDVRVIAATNRNLSQMVTEGAFRQDLYYRVNGFTIDLPPLRHRHGDVALLTNHFIQRFNREMSRNVRAVAPEALLWLQMNPWPGNVRELQSTIKYAMIKAPGDVLTMECFPQHTSPTDSAPTKGVSPRAQLPAVGQLARQLLNSEAGDAYRQIMSLVDETVIQEALNYSKGNQLQAAALLGISRTTLRAKLRSSGLSVEKQVSAAREKTN